MRGALSGTGLVIVELNVPAALQTVDRALILRSSRAVFQGALSKLASHPDMRAWL